MHSSRLGLVVLTGVLALTTTACGADEPAPPGSSPASGASAEPASSARPGSSAASLTVTSPAFAQGAPIPADYTCAGGGKRPQVDWKGDATAKEYALVVSDPDAPGGTYYHWVVVNLPAGTTSIGATLPAGAKELQNSNGSTGWTQPCPPAGTHHYRFTVYGLPGPVPVGADASAQDAAAAIEKSATARGTLTGLVTA